MKAFHILTIALTLSTIISVSCSRGDKIGPEVWVPQDGESPTLVDAVLPYVESIEVPDKADPTGIVVRLHLSCAQAPDRLTGDVQRLWTNTSIPGVDGEGRPFTFAVPYLSTAREPSGEPNNVLEVWMPVTRPGYTQHCTFRVYSASSPEFGGMASNYWDIPWRDPTPHGPHVSYVDYEFDIPATDGGGT